VPAEDPVRATETPVVGRSGPGPLRKPLWFWVLPRSPGHRVATKAVLDDPGLADAVHPDAVYEAEIAERLRRQAEAGAEAAPTPALV
jgi:hypothetical protein